METVSDKFQKRKHKNIVQWINTQIVICFSCTDVDLDLSAKSCPYCMTHALFTPFQTF